MLDALGKLTPRVDHLAGGNNGRSEASSDDSPNRVTQAVVYDRVNPAAGTAPGGHQLRRAAYLRRLLRPTHVARDIELDGVTRSVYVTQTRYDAVSGRVDSRVYLSGFEVFQRYTARGFLEQVESALASGDGAASVYWQAFAMSADGQVTHEDFGNGVTTARGFDSATGLVQGIDTWTASDVPSTPPCFGIVVVGGAGQVLCSFMLRGTPYFHDCWARHAHASNSITIPPATSRIPLTSSRPGCSRKNSTDAANMNSSSTWPTTRT